MIAPCTTDSEAPAALKRLHHCAGSRKAYRACFIPWYRPPTLWVSAFSHVEWPIGQGRRQVQGLRGDVATSRMRASRELSIAHRVRRLNRRRLIKTRTKRDAGAIQPISVWIATSVNAPPGVHSANDDPGTSIRPTVQLPPLSAVVRRASIYQQRSVGVG